MEMIYDLNIPICLYCHSDNLFVGVVEIFMFTNIFNDLIIVNACVFGHSNPILSNNGNDSNLNTYVCM